MKTTLKKSAGFTLIELLIAVAVLTILLVVLVPKVPVITAKFNTYGAQSEIDLLISGVKSLRPNGDFSGDLVTPLTQNDSLPNDLVNGANIQNMFNEVVALSSASVNGGTDNAIVIPYSAPKAVCANLVSQNWKTYHQVDVNGAQVTNANADTACNVDGINALVLTVK